MEQVDKIFAALRQFSLALIGREIAPLIVRQEVHKARLDTVEQRIVQLGERHTLSKSGVKGDQGPMPLHRWQDTSLQFTQGPDGSEWGELVDLKGDRGERGKAGHGGGGGVSLTVPIWSYFPAGF